MDETTARVQQVEALRRVGDISPREVLKRDLQAARAIAQLLDSQFEFRGVKFGLDAILGLIPIVGDVISTAIGFYPIHLARKHRLGRMTLLKMLANLGVDFLIGAVPFAGDAFDVFFKAHEKNYKLLEDAARARGVTIDEN